MAELHDDSLMIDARQLLIGGGIASILIGIAVLLWPEATVTVVAILIGVDLLLLGMVILSVSLVAGTSVGLRILGSLVGVLGILAGVAVFGRPLQTVTILVVVLGAFWVAGGVLEVLSGIVGATSQPRLLAVLSGSLSIIAGAIALSWPGPTVGVLVWITGVWAVVWGGLRLAIGLSMPKLSPAA